MREDALTVRVGDHDVQALLLAAAGAQWLYVLGHGSGAGMRHTFMEAVARRLADHDIATLRYEFPYITAGSRRPDPAPRLEAICRGVAAFAARELPDYRLIAGGKSLGGRMTSRAQAAAPMERVDGVAFLGFPLHPPGTRGTERADHLAHVAVPMLFLQGTRDELADLDLVRGVCDGLGARVTLHIVDGADHGFAVLKRSGRTGEEVLDELASSVAGWVQHIHSNGGVGTRR